MRVFGLRMNLWCSDSKVPQGCIVDRRQDSQMTLSLLEKKVKRKLWNRVKLGGSSKKREDLSDTVPLQLEAASL